MTHLFCKYFHSRLGQSGKARILAFWVKISVSDVKNHFKYVKTKENHIPLEFELSAGQNGTFTL